MPADKCGHLPVLRQLARGHEVLERDPAQADNAVAQFSAVVGILSFGAIYRKLKRGCTGSDACGERTSANSHTDGYELESIRRDGEAVKA
jgi:hypothetical protein